MGSGAVVRFPSVLVCLALLSCAPRMVVTKLYFGLSGPQGRIITTEEFSQFADTCITPNFPDGMTTYATQGVWRDAQGQVHKEGSMVVEIIAPRSDSLRIRIDRIVSSYKSTFDQESVLMVRHRARVAF